MWAARDRPDGGASSRQRAATGEAAGRGIDDSGKNKRGKIGITITSTMYETATKATHRRRNMVALWCGEGTRERAERGSGALKGTTRRAAVPWGMIKMSSIRPLPAAPEGPPRLVEEDTRL